MRRPGVEFPSFRDLKSRSCARPFDNSRARRELGWAPESDRERFLQRAFVIAVLGCLTSPYGAFIAGLIFGLVENGVYVLGDDGVPRLRQVRLGRDLPDGRVAVLAGLDAGEKVVIDGDAARRAQLGSRG